MSIIAKKCNKCGKIKFLSEFGKYSRSKDGYQYYCKECLRQQSKKWRSENAESALKSGLAWYHRNRDYSIEQSRKWKKENKAREKERSRKRYDENKEELYKKSRKWFSEHPEKEKEYQDKWYRNNKEKVRDKIRKWRANNPDKVKEQYHLRISRKNGNGGIITADEWNSLCKKYDYKCLCCGRKNVKLTLDHVIPISLGGSNTIDNAQPLCGSCNSRKGAKHIDYRKR